MTKEVDSQALAVANRALGLTGAGAPQTELADGIIDQFLSVGDIVRRSRTHASREGIFTAVLRAVHGAANSISVSRNPYVLANPDIAIAPYPQNMPDSFDIWLLAAYVRQVSGTGTFTGTLSIQMDSQGWGVDEGDNAVVTSPEFILAFWDALVTESIEFALLAGAGVPTSYPGLRIPRNAASQLRFRSTSSAIATFDCNLILGVFPVSLGQDVKV